MADRDVAGPREAARHHIDRIRHSGGRFDGHATYDCDCGYSSPFADVDEANAALMALTHLNKVLATEPSAGVTSEAPRLDVAALNRHTAELATLGQRLSHFATPSTSTETPTPDPEADDAPCGCGALYVPAHTNAQHYTPEFDKAETPTRVVGGGLREALEAGIREWVASTRRDRFVWSGPKGMTAKDGYLAAAEEIEGLLKYAESQE